jgi:DNA mismatch endonuclease Vsr
MRRVRSSGTTPELAFQQLLLRAGISFDTSTADLPGKPDIVIRSAKIAVFIDGNFWHGGQWRIRKLTSLDEQFTKTKSRQYWLSKIRHNFARDCTQTSRLLEQGWTVLRFWESEVRKNPQGCVEMTVRAIRQDSQPRTTVCERTVAEFFAGIGLMRAGLEKEGWTVVFANDIDEQKKKMYDAHFGNDDGHFVLDDIHKLRGDQIPNCTLATASFPCNDLSLAGSRAGLKGEQSSAFWGFIDVLNKMKAKPPLVLIENVTGFLTSQNGRDFTESLVALNSLGYSVDAFILDAADFVPQSRQRLFILGSLGTERHQCPSRNSVESSCTSRNARHEPRP